MNRAIAIDYGRKRTGIAVTDPMQMIASGLCTVPTRELPLFLKDYFEQEEVGVIVVGEPKQMNNQPSELGSVIDAFCLKLKETYPHKQVVRIDERFTSKMAQAAILQAGAKKKKRQDKALVDQVAATIILQTYLEQKSPF